MPGIFDPETRPFTRRQFLKSTAAAGALLGGLPALIPGSARGADGSVAPGNRITMGVIGYGSQGAYNTRAFLGFPQVQVVAICDVDATRAAAGKEDVESFYGERDGGKNGEFRGCAVYSDFRELLARDDIDTVLIATPDHWHALTMIAAARAGKDIYCEKPFSLTVREGRAMVEATQRYNRVVQIGSQQRSDTRFRHACEMVRNGRLGKLHSVIVGLPTGDVTPLAPEMPIPDGFDYDFWLGPAPWAPYTKRRCHWDFRWIFDYSGGQVTDWGAHHIDIVQWALGRDRSGPVRVEGAGEFPAESLSNIAVNYQFKCTYEDGLAVDVTNKAPNGVRFLGDKAWVFVTRGEIYSWPPEAVETVIGPDEIHLYDSQNHHGNFLECVRARRETIAPPEVAHRTITTCHLGNIAMLTGRPIRWDPQTEMILDDSEAARMLSRAMREPWTL